MEYSMSMLHRPEGSTTLGKRGGEKVSIRDYVMDEEPLPLSSVRELVRYSEHAAFDAVAFRGTLRKHPYDKEKVLLILFGNTDMLPWCHDGSIIEFRIQDILGLDELPSLVDDTGIATNQVKLWVRRGSIAVRFEPFEVTDVEYRPFDVSTVTRGLSWQQTDRRTQ